MAYTPLRISTIKPDRDLSFDLYIFYKERFLKYLDLGKCLNNDQLAKLKTQKIAKFYITDSHEPAYQQYLDEILNEAVNSDTMNVDEKVNVAEGACSTAVERMQKDPGSRSAYKMTENAAKSLRQIVSKNPEALKKIFGKKAKDSDIIIKHSLNVSALSTKLAELIGGFSEKDLDDLSTAGLIHDLGITKLNKDDIILFEKPKDKLTMEDKRVYKLHPKDSADMLAEKPYINAEIIGLVLNHEEVLSGDGPQRKKQLSPLEEILSIVNMYDKRVQTTKKEPSEVMKDIMLEELGNYNLELINKFKSLLKQEGMIG